MTHPLINVALARGGYVTFPTAPVGFSSRPKTDKPSKPNQAAGKPARFAAWLPRWESVIPYPAEVAPCKEKPCRWHILG